MSTSAIPTTVQNVVVLNLSASYGAVLIAAYISCALWGINIMQAYIYYWNYPDDSWPTKTLVAFLLLVDTAHKILVTKVPWFTVIQNWGNVTAILASPEEALHEAWVGSIIVFVVQVYYLRRIGKFASTTRHARSWWLWLIFMILVALSIVQVPYCVFSINKKNIFILLNLRIKRTGLIAAALVDPAIAVAMIFLVKDTDRMSGPLKSKRTSRTIRRLTVIIVNTGLVTAVVAIATLILDETASGTDFWTAIAQYPQCSIYLSTFLANLNARRYIGNAGDGLSNIDDIHFATASDSERTQGDAEAGSASILHHKGSNITGTDSSNSKFEASEDTEKRSGATRAEGIPVLTSA